MGLVYMVGAVVWKIHFYLFWVSYYARVLYDDAHLLVGIRQQSYGSRMTFSKSPVTPIAVTSAPAPAP